MTTAGVRTASALSDPESVPRAHPGAASYRFADGHLRAVFAAAAGVAVEWTPTSSAAGYVVSVTLFPRPG